MAEKSHPIVNQWFNAWNAHDLDQAAACLAEDVTLDQPTETGGVIRGREAVRGFIGDLYTAFPDCQLDVRAILGGDGQVAAEYVFRGTQTGAYRGMQGDENVVENPIVDVMDVRDGAIQTIRRYDRRPAKAPAPPNEAG